MTPTAYIVLPIKDPPKETGWYYVMNANREILPRMDRCVDGKWDNNNKLLIFYWLRPFDLSRMLEWAHNNYLPNKPFDETWFDNDRGRPFTTSQLLEKYLETLNKEK